MQLADVFGSIRRHWKVSIGLLAASVLVLAIFLVTRNEVLPETRYQASVLVLIPAPDDKGIRPTGVPPVLLQGQQTLANSTDTRTAATASAKLTDDERNDVQYSASQNESLDIITLSARSKSEGVAERAASSYGTSYIRARSEAVGSRARSRQRALRSAVGIYRGRLAEVEGDLRSRSVDLSTTPTTSSGSDTTTTTIPENVSEDVALLLTQRTALRSSITQAQQSFASSEIQALTPTAFASTVEKPPAKRLTPPAPSPLVPAGVALGAGLLLALAVPILMDRLDRTVRDPKTAAAVFDAPVLATIPPLRANDRRYLAAAGSPQDHAYRSLAARSIATDRLPRSIVVTSPAGNAHGPVAANFASALADLGLKVVLIATSAEHQVFFDQADGDALHSFSEFLVDAHQGMTAGELGRRLAPTDVENLFVVPSGDMGEGHPSLDGLPPFLAGLEQFGIDITVFAGPPLLEDPTATILAWTTRSVLWTAELGGVTQADAAESASRMELAGVAPFGVAVIGAAT